MLGYGRFLVDVFWVASVIFCCECVLCAVFVFHSGSIITGVGVGWKGLWRLETICFMYVWSSFQIFGLVVSYQLSEPGFTG